MNTYQLKHKMSTETTLFGIGALVLLIGLGALFFHLVEGHSYFDSIYFVMMTMTTVGYGDIVPTSIVGKLITMIYAITGVPLFIFMAWFVVEQRITGLVKTYVKHHTTQILKLESQVDEITENVETITENIEEISENVEQIDQNVEQIQEEETTYTKTIA